MFRIFTDTSANLDTATLASAELRVLPFTFTCDGVEQTCSDLSTFDDAAFYETMRRGALVTTSQITPQTYFDAFRPTLEEGIDVLFVSMSSGISGSFASAQIAAQELKEEFPDRTILLCDTLGASLGEGLLVLDAVACQKQGLSIEQTHACLEEKKQRMCQVFTVDDLRYLRRTGRLSAIKAGIAAILHIRPILKGDTEGRIVCFAKTRGRQNAIEELARQYAAFVQDAASQTVGIAHADCEQDALLLAEKLKAAAAPKNVMIVPYEPVTGSHVGPGTLALFFFGSADFRK